VAAFALVLGCGSGGGPPAPPDGPVDGAVDRAPPDAPVDAPADTGVPDAPADARPDAAPDSEPDGPPDTRAIPDLVPAELTLTPESHDFMAVPVGTMATRVFTLENTGQLGSGTPSLSLMGAADENFRVSSNGCETSLDGHTSCTIEVQFSPSVAGPQSALLEVEASPGGRVSSQLTGSGAL
jgi:hypothetical protein